MRLLILLTALSSALTCSDVLAAVGPLGGEIKYLEFCERGSNGGNDPTNDLGATGQIYLGVEDASDATTDRVIFWFFNKSGGVQSGISSIGFSDGVLLDLTGIVDGDGNDVDTGDDDLIDESLDTIGDPTEANFVQSDEDLTVAPGGQNEAQNYGLSEPLTAFFEADTGNGPNANDFFIDPGETVGIIFQLLNNYTWNDVLTALSEGPDGDPHLEIGIHVQRIGTSGESEKYIVCGEPSDEPPGEGPTPTPEPASLVAWLLGSAGLGLILRGRMKKAAA